jgi:TPP-dependent indolepyruvate ferredoxin oxidoreductase alpha subunit
MGIALAGVEYPFCVVGDTAFVHGGMTALEEAFARDVKMCVIIIDNGGSGSTGYQPTAVNIRNINPAISRCEVNYKSFSEYDFIGQLRDLKGSKDLVVIYVTL